MARIAADELDRIEGDALYARVDLLHDRQLQTDHAIIQALTDPADYASTDAQMMCYLSNVQPRQFLHDVIEILEQWNRENESRQRKTWH